MIVKQRLREWLLLPMALLGLLTWPLWWLLMLPNDVRCRLATRGATIDVGANLAGVTRARVFFKNIPSMASNEEDVYYELVRANGTRFVILDTFDGLLGKRLAARGLEPSQTFRFSDTSGLVWVGWLVTTAGALVLAFILAALSC